MSSGLMKVGGIGCLLWLIGFIIAFLATFAGGAIALVSLIGGIIIVVGMILVSIGGFGLWKHYRHTMPLCAGIFGLIAGIITLIAILLPLGGLGMMGIAAIMGLIAIILLAVFWFLIGISFITLEGPMDTGAALPAGIISMILGAGACSAISMSIVLTALFSQIGGAAGGLGGAAAGMMSQIFGALFGTSATAVGGFAIIPAMLILMVAFFKGK